MLHEEMFESIKGQVVFTLNVVAYKEKKYELSLQLWDGHSAAEPRDFSHEQEDGLVTVFRCEQKSFRLWGFSNI